MMKQLNLNINQTYTLVFDDNIHLRIAENEYRSDKYFTGQVIYTEKHFAVLSLSDYNKELEGFVCEPECVYSDYSEADKLLVEDGKYLIVDTQNAICKYSEEGFPTAYDEKGMFTGYQELTLVPLKPGDDFYLFDRIRWDRERKNEVGMVKAKVAYVHNGVIIVKSADIEPQMDICNNALRYIEAWYLYPDFIDKEAKKSELFLCMDEVSQQPLYKEDMICGLQRAILDDYHKIIGYEDLEMPDLDELKLKFNEFQMFYWIRERKAKGFEQKREELLQGLNDTIEHSVKISLPEEELEKLSAPNEETEDPNVLEYNLPRLQRWFLEKDCAILTTWRKGQTRKTKYSNNKELQTKLRSYNYGVVKVEGRYPEVGKDYAYERSFMVVNLSDDDQFYNNIYALSAEYHQDSFLYKAKGECDAYEIGTNENFIKEIGETRKLGPMFLNKMDEECYTKFKGGRITFPWIE